LRVAKIIPNAPAPESDNQSIAIALNPPYPPVGAVAAALNVKLDFAVLDPGVIGCRGKRARDDNRELFLSALCDW
jgi:hypothetical protein